MKRVPKIIYGSITIKVKATERDININESTLFDEFSRLACDLEDWLKHRTRGIFEFEVKED